MGRWIAYNVQVNSGAGTLGEDWFVDDAILIMAMLLTTDSREHGGMAHADEHHAGQEKGVRPFRGV